MDSRANRAIPVLRLVCRRRKHSSSTPPPAAPPPREFDPKASKKEAPVVLCLPQQGIRLPDGRVAFANREFEVRRGEHLCVIGPNGHGKSLFWRCIGGQKAVDGATGPTASAKELSFMSFSMHKDFVSQYQDTVVCDVLGGSKDALARTLIVSLGLYPVWYKKVGVLSTGEIRKVLLAYVLSKSPRVVVLDKPFDGLDAPSRENLRAVLSQLCQGFPRLLVEGFSKKRIDPSELVLITHRHEEIPGEVTRVVSVRDLDIDYQGAKAELLGRIKEQLTHDRSRPALAPTARLPQALRPQVTRAEVLDDERTRARVAKVVELKDVHLSKGEYVILDRVSWAVQQGQCWAVKGLNGAGKSSIVKLVTEAHERRLQHQQPAASKQHGGFTGRVAVGVPHMGLVSTEVHLSLAARMANVRTDAVVLSGLPTLAAGEGGAAPVGSRQQEALREWGELLQLSSLYDRPFGELSQGQQKLAIIARALVGAPQLLIMDEACQGLDSHHRALVLSLLDRIVANCSWMATLFISHHDDEHLEHATHVLDIKKGKIAFQGSVHDWHRRERHQETVHAHHRK